MRFLSTVSTTLAVIGASHASFIESAVCEDGDYNALNYEAMTITDLAIESDAIQALFERLQDELAYLDKGEFTKVDSELTTLAVQSRVVGRYSRNSRKELRVEISEFRRVASKLRAQYIEQEDEACAEAVDILVSSAGRSPPTTPTRFV